MTSQKNLQLEESMVRFSQQPILVVGDLILDRFVWGRVERISPEAPVPVVEVVTETVHLGGAANVASNLASLGAQPLVVGTIGGDKEGEELLEEFRKQGISSEGVLRDTQRITSTKTRIIAEHQQVCRTDRENRAALSGPLLEDVVSLYGDYMERAGAIIVSDYGKGGLSAKVLQTLIQQSRRVGKFLAVDPKDRDFSIYREASLVTPNKREAEAASGVNIVDEESLLQVGNILLETTAAQYLLITRGEEGMTLFEADRHFNVPTVAREVFDVTGAGDTVIAVLALAVAAGSSMRVAAGLANHAAGVVVGKLGTASVTVDEILLSIAAEG